MVLVVLVGQSSWEQSSIIETVLCVTNAFKGRPGIFVSDAHASCVLIVVVDIQIKKKERRKKEYMIPVVVVFATNWQNNGLITVEGK